MDSNKQRDDRRRHIPFIRIDSATATRNQNSYISDSSSEESLPLNAPLVRQPRCSIDIDTISLENDEKTITNGTESHSNSYLESLDLQESIKDMA